MACSSPTPTPPAPDSERSHSHPKAAPGREDQGQPEGGRRDKTLGSELTAGQLEHRDADEREGSESHIERTGARTVACAADRRASLRQSDPPAGRVGKTGIAGADREGESVGQAQPAIVVGERRRTLAGSREELVPPLGDRRAETGPAGILPLAR